MIWKFRVAVVGFSSHLPIMDRVLRFTMHPRAAITPRPA
jgi:hypothetical protein